MQIAHDIAALVPRRLWSDNHGNGVRTCRGTILFADIAGFTRLTESAMRRSGTRGIEQLTVRINAIFSDLVEVANQSGGDILKFGGDAILIAYDADGSDRQSVAAAIDGASAMERAMVRHRRTTLRALSLHLGMAHGEWNELVAGISGTRREHFVWGDAIARAMRAADASGTRARIECAVSLLPVTKGVSRFQRQGRSVFEFSAGHSQQPNMAFALPSPPSDCSMLWDFVAEDLRGDSRTSLNKSERSAEHRTVSTLFGFWTCPHALDNSSDSVILLNKIFHAVHTTSLAHGGLWARSDPSGDKQKILILFGATQSSPDDTDRALTAARSLSAAFTEIRREDPQLRLGIGVATASVFAGFVGHTQRREFTAMGDGVNLAARLAAKSKRNAILVDKKTRAESLCFQFRNAGELALKNVRKPTAVCVPVAEIDPTTDLIRDDLVEHPLALAECMSRWTKGANSIWLNALSGVNVRKFTAQLLSRIDTSDVDRSSVTFDATDAAHPLGGTRRICTTLLPGLALDIEPQPHSLEDMLHKNGHWAARALLRIGPEAAALAVAQELAHRALPPALVVLDRVEVLGEFDRRVVTALLAQRGPRWLVVYHSDAGTHPLHVAEPAVKIGDITYDEMNQVIGDLLAPARASKSLLKFLFERSQAIPRLACSLASHLIAQGAVTRTNGRHPVWHLRSIEHLDIPNGLRAQYLQRVDRLALRDRHVLCAIAVMGDSAPLEAVGRLCVEIPPVELNESVRQLELQGLLRLQSADGSPHVSIDDPTCRQAVYETMSHQLRESWHEAAASYWLSSDRDNAARVGEHLFRARDPRSARWLRQAARQSRRYWSLDASLRYTRWAILALHGRCEPEYSIICPPFTGELSRVQEGLYGELADILQLQGNHSESGRVQRWLAKLATGRGDQRLACQHRLSAARMELLAGRYLHSQSQARKVLIQSGRLKDERIRAQAAYLLGETYRRSGRVERSLRSLEEAESLVRNGSDHSLHSDVLNALGLLHWNCGRLDDARRCFEESLRQLPRQGDRARRGQVANNLGILTEEQGRLRAAKRFYHKAFTVFDRTGVRRHRAYSLGNLANLYRHGARYERAREAYEEVETELCAMGEAHAAAYTVGNIGDLERDFGDWAAARQRYETTLEFARKSGDEELKSECYARIARLHLLAGRLDLMPRMLAHAARAASLAESREFTLYVQLLTAELDLAKGRIPAATQRLKTAEAGAMNVGLVYYQLWTEHALSRLSASKGDMGRAASRCLAGMSKARSSGYRWWELRFAALGVSELIAPTTRARCRRRFAALVRLIETGIGDSAVRARFLKLPIVREGIPLAKSPVSTATGMHFRHS